MLQHSLSYVTSMNILRVAAVILTLSNVSSLSKAVQISTELSYWLCQQDHLHILTAIPALS